MTNSPHGSSEPPPQADEREAGASAGPMDPTFSSRGAKFLILPLVVLGWAISMGVLMTMLLDL